MLIQNEEYSFVEQIVNQGIQTRFNQWGCFNKNLKEKGNWSILAKSSEHVFLEIKMARSTMFTKGQTNETNIDLWYKQICYINLLKLVIM